MCPRIYRLMGILALVASAQACIHNGPDLESSSGPEADSSRTCVAFIQETRVETGPTSRLVIQVDGVGIASVKLLGFDPIRDAVAYELSLGRESRIEDRDEISGPSSGLLSTKQLVSRTVSLISGSSDGVSQESFVRYFYVSNPKCDLWIYLPASTESHWALSKAAQGRYSLIRTIDPALRKAICTVYDRMSPAVTPVIAPEQVVIYFCTSTDAGFRRLTLPWPSLEPMNYPHCDRAQLSEGSPESK